VGIFLRRWPVFLPAGEESKEGTWSEQATNVAETTRKWKGVFASQKKKGLHGENPVARRGQGGYTVRTRKTHEEEEGG
jgi:hypothetical protein